MNTEFVEAAERIGARLCRDAIWHSGRCNWTSDFLHGDSIAHGALGPDLYDGSSGIALFLWRLAEFTGERIFRLTACAALQHALDHSEAGGGFYSGGVGVAYVACEILQSPQAAEALLRVEPDPARLDLLDGSAGAIAGLLTLYQQYTYASLIDAATRHGDLLIAQASRSDEGWSWKTIEGSRNLTGFSHGTAGIAFALLELYRASGENRFRAAALEAFRYEQTCFSAAENNWPDFREAEPSYPAFWCHGAGGIAFSRLRASQTLDDDALLREARVALDTTQAQTPHLANFSLCHGQAGNADLFIYARDVLGEQHWLNTAEKIAQEGIERYERRRIPWPTGLPGANETPDLMLGLAGIGYFYLRLDDPERADPKRIPSILIPMARPVLRPTGDNP